MLDKIQKFREYLNYVERHYLNVQAAWKLVNHCCKGKGLRFMYDDYYWHTIDGHVKIHDESKLSVGEFTQYRKYFFPAEGEFKEPLSFAVAWEHHKENNPHHWENWTTKVKDAHLQECYLVEMVVDWIAMSFEFGDTAQDYYEKNKAKIGLEPHDERLVLDIFACIYPQGEPELHTSVLQMPPTND